MSQHRVIYNYSLPEGDIIQIDIDPALDRIEKEEIALAEIREANPEFQDVEIVSIDPIDG